MVLKSIRDILAGRPFVYAKPQASLADVADLMSREQVEFVVVLQDGDLCGVISESDILRHVSQRGGFEVTPVSDVMIADVEFVETRSSVSEAFQVMKMRGVQNLPVLDLGQKVIGVLADSDIPREYRALKARSVQRGAALAA